jgi:hypothetical protein
MRGFSDSAVAAVFKAYPPAARARLKIGDSSAIYVHCRSGRVDPFRALYPDTFTDEGQRAIELGLGDRVPQQPLRHCLALALTHHSRKKKPS